MSQEKKLNYLMFHLVSSICEYLDTDKEIVLKIGLTLG